MRSNQAKDNQPYSAALPAPATAWPSWISPWPAAVLGVLLASWITSSLTWLP